MEKQGLDSSNTNNVKEWTNEQFMHNIMNFSPYGALCQPFIIQAIEYYCDKIIKDKERLIAEEEAKEKEGKISLLNIHSWIGVAEDIKKRITEKYGPQNLNQ